MNKIAYLVVVIFLFLSAALWYSAQGSLNSYVKREILIKGKELTGHFLYIDLVKVQPAQGHAIIKNLHLIINTEALDPKLDEKNRLATLKQRPVFFDVEDIDIFFNKNSLKESPIIIDQIILSKGYFNIPADNSQQAIAFDKIKQKLNIVIKDKINQLTANNNKNQPLFKVKTIALVDSSINYYQGEIPESMIERTVKIPEINVDIKQIDSGYPMNIIAGKALSKSFQALRKAGMEQ